MKNNKREIEKARKEIIKRINKLRAEKKKIEKAKAILGEVEDSLNDYCHKTPRHTSVYEADILVCKGMDKIRISLQWIDDEIEYLTKEEERNNGQLPDVSSNDENVEKAGVC